MSTTPVADQIRTKLTAAFSPLELRVEDESHSHAGHSGHDPRGESHLHVLMVSARFEGQSRVARQRAVYQVLAEELADRVHALRLTLRSPAEAAAASTSSP